MISADARRDAFARFIKRALDRAQAARGWSVPRVAKESGIGTNTLYRWIRGEWRESPDGDLIEKFCDTLDVPTEAAFSILWPGRGGGRRATQPLEMEPDLEILARRLNDPNVPEGEKYLIRETVRGLAARPMPPTGAARPRKAS